MKDKTFLMFQGAIGGGGGGVIPRERIDWFVLVIMLFSLINALVIINH